MTDRIEARGAPVAGYHDYDALECRPEPAGTSGPRAAERTDAGESVRSSKGADQLVKSRTPKPNLPTLSPAKTLDEPGDCANKLLEATAACLGMAAFVVGSSLTGGVAVIGGIASGMACGTKVVQANDECGGP